MGDTEAIVFILEIGGVDARYAKPLIETPRHNRVPGFVQRCSILAAESFSSGTHDVPISAVVSLYGLLTTDIIVPHPVPHVNLQKGLLPNPSQNGIMGSEAYWVVAHPNLIERIGGPEMRLAWEVEERDADRVKSFYAKWMSDPFVTLRQKRNVVGPRPAITRDTMWMALVGCLMTTRQRSGPRSHVKQFLDMTPFPFNYKVCSGRNDLETFARDTMASFGGIRRGPTIARQMHENYLQLENGLWSQMLERAETVSKSDNPWLEREVVHWLKLHLKGIGPKQSRNLLQWVGASRYEIPVDSRITRWLNENILKDRLSGQLLANDTYADMVSDGIQILCKQTNIYPCMLDAAIFASVDGGWGENDLVADSLQNA